jgi:AraC-like DNA-binding protein
MFYQKFLPCEQLAPFVECYYIWENETADRSFSVESPPNAYTAIVFNYADDYYVSTIKVHKQKVPKQFLVGQLTYSYTLHLPGKIGIAAIVFKPAGIASIFARSMFAFTEERTDLSVVLEKAIIENTAGEISSTGDAKEKADFLEKFVLHFYNVRKPAPDLVDEAANLIVANHGKVNINELCNEIFISRRQFERRFLQKVGLSPKYYARLRRIGYICSVMAGKEDVNWQDLYYDLDYYDQSHFIKDFKIFTGRSPSDYVKGNTELIHHLKSK